MNVLVTDATAGFGRAIALQLAAAVHIAVTLGRRRERLEQLAA
jgi:3-hydroxy acid dehydrogenase / malonic semialdehyde reductase